VNPCERYLTAINELVDGTLGPIRRAELELHLESCDACRALAADLREIARTARALEPLTPPQHVWTEIAGTLQQEGRVTAGSFGASRRRNVAMLALAAALVIAVGASLVMLMPRPRDAATPGGQTAVDQQRAPDAGNAADDDPVEGVDSELTLSQQHFQNAVEEAKKTVDPQTIAVMQKSLGDINEALRETRAALKKDPQSTQARQSFYDVLKQKIQFLQDTIALMNQMRKGDAAGAAQIVEGGKS
jgi:Putative zinc-finger